jgi:4a-hydroxytetrahydrobiopterin dehydratase
MTELLTPEEIEAAVAALPAWAADGDRLVRKVQVPADSQAGLLEAVARVADEMDHHPDVERTDDAVTFRLWTHSAGGVTAKDVDLAGRIDAQLSGAADDHGS